MYKLRGILKFRETGKILELGSRKNIFSLNISSTPSSYVNFIKFNKNTFSEKSEEKSEKKSEKKSEAPKQTPKETPKETFATKQEFGLLDGDEEKEKANNTSNIDKNQTSSEKQNISPDLLNDELQNKYSYPQIRDLVTKVSGGIENNTYTFKNKLPSNFFGQNLLYLSSSTIPYKYLANNVEFSGVLTLSIISVLNWNSLIFPSQYLFNYLFLCTVFAYSKLVWRFRFLGSFIYQVLILDEEYLKVTYINGEIDVVPIKNIYLSNKMRDLLVLQEDSKSNSQPIQQYVPIEVRVNGRKDALILLQNTVKFNTFVELEPLLAVLQRETRRIRI